MNSFSPLLDPDAWSAALTVGPPSPPPHAYADRSPLLDISASLRNSTSMTFDSEKPPTFLLSQDFHLFAER